MRFKNVNIIIILKRQSTHNGSKYQQFKCADDTLSSDRPKINLYKPSVHFVGYSQTIQTQLRRRRMLYLIRVSTVCLMNTLSDLNINEKHHPTTL